MNEKNKVFNFFLIFFICIFVAIFVYATFVVVEVKTIEMHINVTDYTGVNADNDKIYFGALIPVVDSISERKVLVENGNDFAVKVDAIVYGEISEYVTLVDQGDRILEPGESGYLYYVFEMKKPLPLFGEITGETKIFLRRVLI